MLSLLLSLALTLLPSQEAVATLHPNSKGRFCTSKSVVTGSQDEEFRASSSDHLHFGRLWKQIKLLEKQDLLLEMIAKRKKEIAALKEHWRSKVENFKSGTEAHFYQEIEECITQGKIVVSSKGYVAAYFLLDANDHPRFVIKPIDEDILCLNNRKNYASPFNDSRFRVRYDIPLYRSAQAEALSYAVAREIGLAHMTPKTVISIISHENFFDISDPLEADEKAFFLQHVGSPDKEKLCSIQEYIPNMTQLFELVHEWIDHDVSDQAIEDSINQKDFEDAIILIWSTYDTDAHAGNIHVKLDSPSVYSLKKFDNGLTFPEKNTHLFNALSCIPNCLHPLSPHAQQKVRDIPVATIVELMKEYEMDEAIEAFLERMGILKTLNECEKMTIYEIDLRLRALELSYGKDIALSEISIEELEAQVFGNELEKKEQLSRE